MSPTIALFVWFVCISLLLFFDPARQRRSSAALWVALVWMFIVGTRLPSQWVGSQLGQSAQALEEGNPLDRAIFTVLILIATVILFARSFKWGSFIAKNFALVVFLIFALTSVLWSDFPFVAFKRWFRDLGNYLIVLLILSDERPVEAFGTVFRRYTYLLLPLSILLNKYFPWLSKQYDWVGAPSYIGATTSKNMLGLVCLICGLFLFWDIVTRWQNRKDRNEKRIIWLDTIFFGMALWLLHVANSATSRVCLLLGCVLIMAAYTKFLQRHPGLLRIVVPAGAIAYVILAYGFDINAHIAGAVGRDPTLTDRTKIWSILLSMDTNPILGTGYESFWLGSRLKYFWEMGLGRINEAHNGYLEVYLHLGFVGLFLLVIFLISGYRKIGQKLGPKPVFASFALAAWAVSIFYNITEAAFKGGLLWIMLLTVSITIADRSRVTEVDPEEERNHLDQFEQNATLDREVAGSR